MFMFLSLFSYVFVCYLLFQMVINILFDFFKGGGGL